jgi:hypothetical protein
MSSILYYSNFCNHSKQLLQTLSKAGLANRDIHFICIDKRVKDPAGKTFVILENGQKMIIPENVTRVPALFLLNQGYHVLYGEAILQHLKPKQEAMIKQATFSNMEPSAFAFGSGGVFGAVVSDQYSFLDQDSEQLSAKGNGGMRQMHNYVDLNYVDSINPVPQEESDVKNSGRIQGITVEQLQSQRDQEFQKIAASNPGPFAQRR